MNRRDNVHTTRQMYFHGVDGSYVLNDGFRRSVQNNRKRQLTKEFPCRSRRDPSSVGFETLNHLSEQVVGMFTDSYPPGNRFYLCPSIPA